MRSSTVLVGLLVVALVSACGDSTRHGVVGEWVGYQGDQEVKILFRPDSTFVMDLGSFAGEGTFSVDEDRRVEMRPVGSLATVIPAGFTGSVDDFGLNVCSPAGICSDFERID